MRTSKIKQTKVNMTKASELLIPMGLGARQGTPMSSDRSSLPRQLLNHGRRDEDTSKQPQNGISGSAERPLVPGSNGSQQHLDWIHGRHSNRICPGGPYSKLLPQVLCQHNLLGNSRVHLLGQPHELVKLVAKLVDTTLQKTSTKIL